MWVLRNSLSNTSFSELYLGTQYPSLMPILPLSLAPLSRYLCMKKEDQSARFCESMGPFVTIYRTLSASRILSRFLAAISTLSINPVGAS